MKKLLLLLLSLIFMSQLSLEGMELESSDIEYGDTEETGYEADDLARNDEVTIPAMPQWAPIVPSKPSAFYKYSESPERIKQFLSPKISPEENKKIVVSAKAHAVNASPLHGRSLFEEMFLEKSPQEEALDEFLDQGCIKQLEDGLLCIKRCGHLFFQLQFLEEIKASGRKNNCPRCDAVINKVPH